MYILFRNNYLPFFDLFSLIAFVGNICLSLYLVSLCFLFIPFMHARAHVCVCVGVCVCVLENSSNSNLIQHYSLFPFSLDDKEFSVHVSGREQYR